MDISFLSHKVLKNLEMRLWGHISGHLVGPNPRAALMITLTVCFP